MFIDSDIEIRIKPMYKEITYDEKNKVYVAKTFEGEEKRFTTYIDNDGYYQSVVGE